jgi:hypothetical protein
MKVFAMSKYAPLTEFLRKQPLDEVWMTFAQVERVIDAKLPPKAQHHRAWWSNSPSNSVMTKAWLDAGFRSEQVDMEGRKLVFRRVAPKGSVVPKVETSGDTERAAVSKRHPLIGWMKGTVRIAPGVDLTEPADPEWGERAWGDRK